MAVHRIKNKGLRKRGLPKVFLLKIHRPDLHFSSFNGVNVAPFHSSMIRSVPIDTIQVVRSTVIVPPGSLYFLCTVN